MLEATWERKGDCVTLSSRLSSRMKTRETACSTVKRSTSGPTATRNHGKTLLITPRQNTTRITFWMNISAWNGRRVSTEARKGETKKEKNNLKVTRARFSVHNPNLKHFHWNILLQQTGWGPNLYFFSPFCVWPPSSCSFSVIPVMLPINYINQVLFYFASHVHFVRLVYKTWHIDDYRVWL